MAAPYEHEEVVNAQHTEASPASPISLEQAARKPASASASRRTGLLYEMSDIVRDVLQHWELAYYLVLRDVKIRYKQAAMGFGWALLMPLMIVGAGLVIQIVLAHGSGQPVSLSGLAGTAVKALPWAFFVGSIQIATNSLTSNMNLVSKIFFPREVLPVSAVFAQAFDSLIGVVAVTLVLPFLGVRPSTGLFWVPLIALLLLFFTLGTSLFLSCANLFYRDVKYLVQLLLTFGIFFTPVLFEPSMLGARGATLVMLNPLAVLLEAFRLAVVVGHNLLVPLYVTRAGVHIQAWAPWYLGYAIAWTVLGFSGALLMFRRLQFLFAEFI